MIESNVLMAFFSHSKIKLKPLVHERPKLPFYPLPESTKQTFAFLIFSREIKNKLVQNRLTHFMPLVSFCTSRTHKTKDFLVFSGNIKRDHVDKMF